MSVAEEAFRVAPRAAALARRIGPGLALAAVVAVAATALGARYDAPAMLFALLLGMALSGLGEEVRAAPGLKLAASSGLRAGVALMGLAVSVETAADLGAPAALSAAGLLLATLAFAFLLGRRLGWPACTALTAAGAVSICGASAALSISALLPGMRERRGDVTAVIMTATALSSAAMALYPVILSALGFDDRHAGFVLGASIHDVAQVIGAGYSVSEQAGETATLTKMARVSMLPLVLLGVSLAVARGALGDGREAGGKADLKPLRFVLVFALLFVFGALFDVPDWVREGASDLSRALFLAAIAAIGLTSRMREILAAGPRAFAAMGAATLLLFCGAVAAAALLV